MAASQLRPLIVEWPSADRLALESQARRGLIAVHYAGCELEVLERCTLDGAYGYQPGTPKRDSVTMRDTDDLYANIPAGAAKLEAKLKSAGQLNVAMTMVGRLEAQRIAFKAGALPPECARATHVVIAMTVGAFEFFTGAEAQVGAGVGIGGLGGGASRTTARETLTRDGDASACASATDSDARPPSGCGAIVRLDLVSLGDVRPMDTQARAQTPAAPPANAAMPLPIPAAAPAAGAPSPAAGGRGPTTLEARCNAGEASACTSWGMGLRDGLTPDAQPVVPDPPKAAAFFKRGCDGGDSLGCLGLGGAHAQGVGVPRDGRKAVELFGKACDKNIYAACFSLGITYQVGLVDVAPDRARARTALDKACRGGLAGACVQLGTLGQ